MYKQDSRFIIISYEDLQYILVVIIIQCAFIRICINTTSYSRDSHLILLSVLILTH